MCSFLLQTFSASGFFKAAPNDNGGKFNSLAADSTDAVAQLTAVTTQVRLLSCDTHTHTQSRMFYFHQEHFHTTPTAAANSGSSVFSFC